MFVLLEVLESLSLTSTYTGVVSVQVLKESSPELMTLMSTSRYQRRS